MTLKFEYCGLKGVKTCFSYFHFRLKHVNVMEITFIESYEGPLCVLQHEY